MGAGNVVSEQRKVFTTEEVETFLRGANLNDQAMLVKLACVVCSICSSKEITKMKTLKYGDVKKLSDGYRISNETVDAWIPTKYTTCFRIFDLYFTKITEFFPTLAPYDPLLLYCNKKFGAEKLPLGINPIFNIPKINAQDLGLDNPHLYTAKKCFSKVTPTSSSTKPELAPSFQQGIIDASMDMKQLDRKVLKVENPMDRDDYEPTQDQQKSSFSPSAFQVLYFIQ